MLKTAVTPEPPYYAEHREAQQRGRHEWYAEYHLRIARVERAKLFEAPEAEA